MGLGSPHASGQLGYGPLAQYTVRRGCIIHRVWGAAGWAFVRHFVGCLPDGLLALTSADCARLRSTLTGQSCGDCRQKSAAAQPGCNACCCICAIPLLAGRGRAVRLLLPVQVGIPNDPQTPMQPWLISQAEGQLQGSQGGPAAHSEAARRLLLDGSAAAPGADDGNWGSLPKKVRMHGSARLPLGVGHSCCVGAVRCTGGWQRTPQPNISPVVRACLTERPSSAATKPEHSFGSVGAVQPA